MCRIVSTTQDQRDQEIKRLKDQEIKREDELDRVDELVGVELRVVLDAGVIEVPNKCDRLGLLFNNVKLESATKTETKERKETNGLLIGGFCGSRGIVGASMLGETEDLLLQVAEKHAIVLVKPVEDLRRRSAMRTE